MFKFWPFKDCCYPDEVVKESEDGFVEMDRIAGGTNWTLDANFFQSLTLEMNAYGLINITDIVDEICRSQSHLDALEILNRKLPSSAKRFFMYLWPTILLGFNLRYSSTRRTRTNDSDPNWDPSTPFEFAQCCVKTIEYYRQSMAPEFSQMLVEMSAAIIAIHGRALDFKLSETQDELGITWIAPESEIGLLLDELSEAAVMIKESSNNGTGDQFKALRTRIIKARVAHKTLREEDKRRQLEIHKRLKLNALPPQDYDARGKEPCSNGTRIQYQEDIQNWIVGRSDIKFWWITGPPGAGKSAIVSSIVDWCQKPENKVVLGAQYFIDRNRNKSTHPRHYFPTLTKQISDRFAFSVVQKDTLPDMDFDLAGMPLERAYRYFVKAINAASKLSKDEPVVVIIDGLDETTQEEIEETILTFSKLVDSLNPEVRILISSRPESQIQAQFKDKKHGYVLNLRIKDSEKEVDAFLRKGILSLAAETETKSLDILCSQAGGLYVWAVTLLKYFRSLGSSNALKQVIERLVERENPVGRLDAETLDGETENAVLKMNNLYQVILEIALANRDVKVFQKILGYLVIFKVPLRLGDIAALLDPANPPNGAKLVMEVINVLRSVLVEGIEDIHESTIPRFHRSFADFLTTKPARLGDPKEHYVDLKDINYELALDCSRALIHWHGRGLVQAPGHNMKSSKSGILRPFLSLIGSNSRKEPKQLCEPSPTLTPWSVRYAAHYATSHLISSFNKGIDGGILHVDPQSPGCSNFTISNQKILHITTDDRLAMTSSGDTIYISGPHGTTETRQSPKIIKVIQAGSRNITGIMFSPDGRCIASIEERTIRIWDLETGSEVDKLVGHTDVICSAAFSPDGTYIATGSSDKSIGIWKAESGNLGYRNQKIIRHNSVVTSVAFSPDSSCIASGCSDMSIQTWDTLHCKQIRKFTGHEHSISRLAFSPDGVHLASSSLDGTIRIWDAHDGKEKRKIRVSDGDVPSIAFSPYGTRLVSTVGSPATVIGIWDTWTGAELRSISGHVGLVPHVIFSPSGEHIFSATLEGSITTWDVGYGREVKQIGGQGEKTWSFAVSSDGSRLASCPVDTAQITLRETGMIYQSIVPITEHNATVTCAAFSEDGSLMASCSKDRVIILWRVGPNDKREQSHSEACMGDPKFVAISPNNQRLCCISADKQVHIYEIDAHKKFRLMKRSAHPFVNPISMFFSDDDFITVVSDGCKAWTYSIASEEHWQISTESDNTRAEIIKANKRGKYSFRPLDKRLGYWVFIQDHIIYMRDGSVTIGTHAKG